MSWELTQLDEVAQFLSGFAFKSDLFNSEQDGMPIVRIRDVQRGYSDTYYSGRADDRYVVNDGDYLIGMDGEFNLAVWRGGEALLNQRVCKIQAVESSRLDMNYLARFLTLELKKIEAATPFVTVKHLSSKQLNKIIIPLPPLEQQKRIAAILDKADELRAKRRRAIVKLDELLKSVFLELFGDPATNPKGWPELPLGDTAIKFADGPFGSNLKSSHYQLEGVRVIRLQNIGVGYLDERDQTFISEEHFSSLPNNHCIPGDIVVGTMGDPNLRACILPSTLKRALNKADCVLYRMNPQLMEQEYACWLLNMPSMEIKASSLSLGQTRLRISMGRLKTLVVPVPPLDVQRSFKRFVQNLENQKSVSSNSLVSTEKLFSSLQARAFSGDLTPDALDEVEAVAAGS